MLIAVLQADAGSSEGSLREKAVRETGELVSQLADTFRAAVAGGDLEVAGDAASSLGVVIAEFVRAERTLDAHKAQVIDEGLSIVLSLMGPLVGQTTT